jgi:RNA polymerase sigma-70 factor (ECF subfamily)
VRGHSEQVVEPDLLERVWMDRLRVHDSAAWDELVERFNAPLTHLVCSLLGGWCEDVPDIVQDSFVKAFGSIARFRGECSLRTWLFRIAVNLCRDYQKSAWRRRVDLQGNPSETRLVEPQGVAEQPFRDVEWEQLRLALSRVPEKERVCVELRFIYQMTGREISAVVGCTESTVWSRIYAGLKRLRAALSEEEMTGK